MLDSAREVLEEAIPGVIRSSWNMGNLLKEGYVEHLLEFFDAGAFSHRFVPRCGQMEGIQDQQDQDCLSRPDDALADPLPVFTQVQEPHSRHAFLNDVALWGRDLVAEDEDQDRRSQDAAQLMKSVDGQSAGQWSHRTTEGASSSRRGRFVAWSKTTFSHLLPLSEHSFKTSYFKTFVNAFVKPFFSQAENTLPPHAGVG